MNLVYTINIPVHPERAEFFNICETSICGYAKKIGADFRVIRERSCPTEWPHVEKSRAKGFLREFDRILFLDCDIIVKPDAPDIFDLDPGCFWVLSETSWNPCDSQPHHGTLIDRFGPMDCPKTPDGRWHYYNTGVMLFDRSQTEVFDNWDWDRFFCDIFEQTYLNGLIIKYGNPRCFDLKWNCMQTFHSRRKEEAWFVHYTDADKCGDVAKEDWKKWKR